MKTRCKIPLASVAAVGAMAVHWSAAVPIVRADAAQGVASELRTPRHEVATSDAAAQLDTADVMLGGAVGFGLSLGVGVLSLPFTYATATALHDEEQYPYADCPGCGGIVWSGYLTLGAFALLMPYVVTAFGDEDGVGSGSCWASMLGTVVGGAGSAGLMALTTREPVAALAVGLLGTYLGATMGYLLSWEPKRPRADRASIVPLIAPSESGLTAGVSVTF